jgi:hypothetical protein
MKMTDRNADMRHILSQIQTVQQSLGQSSHRDIIAENVDIDLTAARVALQKTLDGDDMQSVRCDIRAEAGLDRHGGKDPHNFNSLFNSWCDNAVSEAMWQIRRRIEGGKLRAWREIRADENWTPEQQHPGIYWSWDENTAEAHWGGGHEGHGPVTWMMEALLNPAQINWPITIAMNANPSYEEEREVRIFPNTPVEIVRSWQR